jgi:hypothetical protein
VYFQRRTQSDSGRLFGKIAAAMAERGETVSHVAISGAVNG